jgi:hypothetical protein
MESREPASSRGDVEHSGAGWVARAAAIVFSVALVTVVSGCSILTGGAACESGRAKVDKAQKAVRDALPSGAVASGLLNDLRFWGPTVLYAVRQRVNRPLTNTSERRRMVR